MKYQPVITYYGKDGLSKRKYLKKFSSYDNAIKHLRKLLLDKTEPLPEVPEGWVMTGNYVKECK